MKYTTTPVSAPESTILAADTYVAIPFTVTESGVVKAGYPMAKTGKKASATTGVSDAAVTDAIGILLHTVDPSVNPNGALLIQGVVDQKKAKASSGFSFTADDVAALHKAVPAVFSVTTSAPIFNGGKTHGFQKYFTSDALAEYWTNDVTNAQAFGSDALFPPRKKAGLELKWIRGHKGVGISLMPSAFDTKATFRERKGFKMSETEMPFFREGFHIDEKDRQMLMEIQNSKSTFAEEIISRISMMPQTLLRALELFLNVWRGSCFARKTANPVSLSRQTA